MSECATFISRHLDFLKANFRCKQDGDRTIVTTPYLYPDFDCIEVSVRECADGRLVVSDLGDALHHVLVMCGRDIFDSQEPTIRHIASTHNLILADDGELIALSSYPEVGQAIFQVAMAMKAIADLVHTAKAKREVHFIDQVRSFLGQRNIPFTPHYPIKGKSLSHVVDLFVNTRGGQLVQVIGPESRKDKVLETYVIYNDLAEAKVAMPKLVLVPKTLSRSRMEMLRSKSDDVILLHKPEEVLAAIG